MTNRINFDGDVNESEKLKRFRNAAPRIFWSTRFLDRLVGLVQEMIIGHQKPNDLGCPSHPKSFYRKHDMKEIECYCGATERFARATELILELTRKQRGDEFMKTKIVEITERVKLIREFGLKSASSTPHFNQLLKIVAELETKIKEDGKCDVHVAIED